LEIWVRRAGRGALLAAILIALPSIADAQDFQTKCQGPGVIGCWGLDSPSELFYNWPTGTVCDAAFAGKTNHPFGLNRLGPGNTAAAIQNGQCVFPVIDTSIKQSGAGSLKFTIPSNSGANSSGFYSEVFKRLPGGGFAYIGPGSPLGNVFYFQFYQRFDPNFVSINYQCAGGCGGWKQMIWYGNPPLGSSSSSIEVTHNNGWQRDVPQMYGQQGHDDYGIEDAVGCTSQKAGSLQSGYASRPNYRAPLNPTCKHYIPDTWMEFTGRVEIRGSSNAPASRVQLWVDGTLVIDYGSAKVAWGDSDGDGFGSFQVTPYHTNKDSSQVHPVGFTWIDSIIVSTQPIPMGGVVSVAPSPPSILIVQ
jgi:hypothetical protein